MTAPRFPFEKSYSGLIGLSLLLCGTASGNQAMFAIALGEYDNQNLSGASQADGHEATLSSRIEVFDGRDGEGKKRLTKREIRFEMNNIVGE